MKRINLDNASYKEWIGLPAAFVFWIASLICFIFGLAFKTGTGIFIPGTNLDITTLFSLGLGFANTAVQIVGNDTDKEDLGIALWLMWLGSYFLGIGSNVNYLYSVIGLNNIVLQFMVCWGLGIMIEVAPERLLVKFLRSIGILGDTKKKVTTSHPTNYSQPSREERHEQMRKQTRPQQSMVDFGIEVDKISLPSQDLPSFLQQKGQGNRNGNVSR